jgi:hypothetical protein
MEKMISLLELATAELGASGVGSSGRTHAVDRGLWISASPRCHRCRLELPGGASWSSAASAPFDLLTREGGPHTATVGGFRIKFSKFTFWTPVKVSCNTKVSITR